MVRQRYATYGNIVLLSISVQHDVRVCVTNLTLFLLVALIFHGIRVYALIEKRSCKCI